MKKFTQFVKESNDTDIMPHDIKDFEFAATYLKDDRARGRYMDALQKFWKAYNEKSIYNADFNETYSYDLARPLEKAYDAVYFKHVEKMREQKDFSNTLFAINSIKKLEREWKAKEHDYPEIYRFIYSIRKLPDFIKTVKSYVIKGRKPKEPVPGAFVKPMIPYEAKKAAIQILDAAINDIRNKYYESMEKAFNEDLEKIKKIVTEKPVTWEMIRGSSFHRIKPTVHLSQNEMILAQDILETDGYKLDAKLQLRDDAYAIAKKRAREQVDMIIGQFLAKNSEKLGHIFAKKAKIADHKIVYNRVNARNLENEMFFKFDDNSSFSIYTSTVYGYTTRGALFVKYPTRFTNVIMKDGTKMGMPSEEKMIKEF